MIKKQNIEFQLYVLLCICAVWFVSGQLIQHQQEATTTTGRRRLRNRQSDQVRIRGSRRNNKNKVIPSFERELQQEEEQQLTAEMQEEILLAFSTSMELDKLFQGDDDLSYGTTVQKTRGDKQSTESESQTPETSGSHHPSSEIENKDQNDLDDGGDLGGINNSYLGHIQKQTSKGDKYRKDWRSKGDGQQTTIFSHEKKKSVGTRGKKGRGSKIYNVGDLYRIGTKKDYKNNKIPAPTRVSKKQDHQGSHKKIINGNSYNSIDEATTSESSVGMINFGKNEWKETKSSNGGTHIITPTTKPSSKRSNGPIIRNDEMFGPTFTTSLFPEATETPSIKASSAATAPSTPVETAAAPPPTGAVFSKIGSSPSPSAHIASQPVNIPISPTTPSPTMAAKVVSSAPTNPPNESPTTKLLPDSPISNDDDSIINITCGIASVNVVVYFGNERFAKLPIQVVSSDERMVLFNVSQQSIAKGLDNNDEQREIVQWLVTTEGSSDDIPCDILSWNNFSSPESYIASCGLDGYAEVQLFVRDSRLPVGSHSNVVGLPNSCAKSLLNKNAADDDITVGFHFFVQCCSSLTSTTEEPATKTDSLLLGSAPNSSAASPTPPNSISTSFPSPPGIDVGHTNYASNKSTGIPSIIPTQELTTVNPSGGESIIGGNLLDQNDLTEELVTTTLASDGFLFEFPPNVGTANLTPLNSVPTSYHNVDVEPTNYPSNNISTINPTQDLTTVNSSGVGSNIGENPLIRNNRTEEQAAMIPDPDSLLLSFSPSAGTANLTPVNSISTNAASPPGVDITNHSNNKITEISTTIPTQQLTIVSSSGGRQITIGPTEEQATATLHPDSVLFDFHSSLGTTTPVPTPQILTSSLAPSPPEFETTHPSSTDTVVSTMAPTQESTTANSSGGGSIVDSNLFDRNDPLASEFNIFDDSEFALGSSSNAPEENSTAIYPELMKGKGTSGISDATFTTAHPKNEKKGIATDTTGNGIARQGFKGGKGGKGGKGDTASPAVTDGLKGTMRTGNGKAGPSTASLTAGIKGTAKTGTMDGGSKTGTVGGSTKTETVEIFTATVSPTADGTMGKGAQGITTKETRESLSSSATATPTNVNRGITKTGKGEAKASKVSTATVSPTANGTIGITKRGKGVTGKPPTTSAAVTSANLDRTKGNGGTGKGAASTTFTVSPNGIKGTAESGQNLSISSFTANPEGITQTGKGKGKGNVFNANMDGDETKGIITGTKNTSINPEVGFSSTFQRNDNDLFAVANVTAAADVEKGGDKKRKTTTTTTTTGKTRKTRRRTTRRKISHVIKGGITVTQDAEGRYR